MARQWKEEGAKGEYRTYLGKTGESNGKDKVGGSESWKREKYREERKQGRRETRSRKSGRMREKGHGGKQKESREKKWTGLGCFRGDDNWMSR